MNYQNDALFGDQKNTSLMGADMLNSGAAQNSMDWGAVLANGIRGAAQGAMAASVNGAYASGQLQGQAPGRGAANGGLMPLLLIGGVLYLVMQS